MGAKQGNRKRNRELRSNLRRGRLALALAGALAMPAAPALAQSNLPQSGSVTSGTATIGQSGSTMTITQTTRGAIIDWSSFNVGSGYTVTFDQQFGNNSVTLNRDLGSSPSYINGSLTANGSVFLINPMGITFGSGAQVNVGGLLASTIDISNGDFLSGVSSGHYRFATSGSGAGGVWNLGQLTAADGGTVALIGARVENAGTISANHGSVVFGATRDVTLDFFGDGLTQITVSGTGLWTDYCSSNCYSGIYSSGRIDAVGGHVDLRTNTLDGLPAMASALNVDPSNGGRIWITGVVSARTDGSRRGEITLDAGMGNVDLGGQPGQVAALSVGATGAGERAGTVRIRGSQLFQNGCHLDGNLDCLDSDRAGLILANGTGIGGIGGDVHIDVDRLYNFSFIQAAGNGAGGSIDINADHAEIYSLIGAWSEGSGGTGGTINITANSMLIQRGVLTPAPYPGEPFYIGNASLVAMGIDGQGGTINLNVADNLAIQDAGGYNPADPDLLPLINLTGRTGGTLNIQAGSFSLPEGQYFDASGTTAGGHIDISAGFLQVAGGLVAAGGTVTTRGNYMAFDPTAHVDAASWMLHAPDVEIGVGSGSGDGAFLSDAALGASLDRGTRIAITADAGMASSGTGTIRIDDGVSIVHSTGDAAALSLAATGGIHGGGFTIGSTGGALDLDFRANIHGDDPDHGYVSFHDVDLDSNGGSITLEGIGSGVYLEYGNVISSGGDIHLAGEGDMVGVYLRQTTISSGAGDIVLDGVATLVEDQQYPFGVILAGSGLTSTSGDIRVTGDAVGGGGIQSWAVFDSNAGIYTYSGITTGSGAITLNSSGKSGLQLDSMAIATDSGDITITASASDANVTAAVFVGSGGLSSNGGDIHISGTGGETGVWLYGGDIVSNGGDVVVEGQGFSYGVELWDNLVSSGAGDIAITGTATGAGTNSTGVMLRDASLAATSGAITLTGSAEQGAGVVFGALGPTTGGSVTTTSGAITVASTGLLGLNAADIPFITDTGDITLEGHALGSGPGVYVGSGGLTSNGGDITLVGSSVDGAGIDIAGAVASHGGAIAMDGRSGSGAGLVVSSQGSVDADDGLVVLRAGNAGASDAIVLQGRVASASGVALLPHDTTDAILLGAGNGFSLTAAELAMIDSPLLVIGSAQHAGAIRVTEAVSRDGDLTLQNEGGSGGIDLQAALDVGSHTLALASGGSITQTSAGAITAHSLLARAGGDVLLAAAENNVAANTLAGAAGGDFEFLDADSLAVGSVSARGMDASTGQLAGLSANGIGAAGDVLVRNLAGDLVLNAGISGNSIDLVIDGTFQNAAAATLSAANGWRVWAADWAGEERGGLAGSGSLPNLYGCTWGGSCAASAPTAGNNYFIYRQQPVAYITVADASREYGLADPAFTYAVSGTVLGDNPDNVASGNLSSTATIGSDVGQYAITGSFLSAAGYSLQYAPGVLTITPATLVFTADSFIRYFGFSNPPLTGTLTGFRNGDTLASVFGNALNIYSPADAASPMGYYPILASGTATNYVIQQAPGNATALQVMPAPQTTSILVEFIGETQETYVYETNMEREWMCPLGASTDDPLAQEAGGDALGRDWLKVRQRMRLSNCIDNKSAPGCQF